MTDVELAWLAGLLEGEGCFSNRADRNCPVIEVKMTDLDVINRVAEMFGRTAWLIPAQRKGYQDQYRTKIQGEPARELMRKLLPMMGERRSARIQELLSFN
jgi:hypothetical protein